MDIYVKDINLCSPYHDITACDNTLGINNLLLHYKNNRSQLYNLVLNDPYTLIRQIWTTYSPLAYDKECRCKMGKKHPRSPYSCVQCKSLRRLTNLPITDLITLQCGDKMGKQLQITEEEIGKLYLREESSFQAKFNIFNHKYLDKCGTPTNFKALRFLCGDIFTIKTIINTMLNEIFTKKGLPHCNKILNTFVCNNLGYNLYEYSPILQDINYTKEIVKSIWTQLLVIMKELQKLNYNMGQPDYNLFTLITKPVGYLYDGVKIEGEYTLQLNNFDYSSATFNNNHYFTGQDLHLDKCFLTPEIVLKDNTTCPQQFFYKINEHNLDVYNNMRHIGFPLFVGSLDFYTIICSMMCNNTIKSIVEADPFLNKIWLSMWQPEDLIHVNANLKEKDEFTKGMDILKGVWLKCDIINEVWKMIKFP